MDNASQWRSMPWRRMVQLKYNWRHHKLATGPLNQESVFLFVRMICVSGGGFGPDDMTRPAPAQKQENLKRTQFRMVLMVLRAFLGRAVHEPLARRA